MLPSRASSPICPNETIRSGLIQASGNPRTRHHEPEILNILNWPEVMLSGVLIPLSAVVKFWKLSRATVKEPSSDARTSIREVPLVTAMT